MRLEIFSHKRSFICLFALIAALLMGCGEKSNAGILDEISGVWGVRGQRGLFSILYTDKTLRLLVDDQNIPMALGAIDNQNGTVNLNVTLNNGKPGIWTISQIWDKEHKSFHLQLTFHDGEKAELTFVRKISPDDLNKIAHAERNGQAQAATNAAEKSVEAAAPAVASPPTPPTQAQPVSLNTQQPNDDALLSPEFKKCASAATTNVETSECLTTEAGKQDARLNAAYKLAMASAPNKDDLRAKQREWIKQRDKECAPDQSGGSSAMLISEDCFMRITANRATELEAIR